MVATVVVDASLALKWPFREEHSSQARVMVAQWILRGVTRAVPSLFAYEVASVIHRRSRVGGATQSDVELVLERLLGMVAVRDLDLTVLKRATAIADELRQSAVYDSQYVALAEREGCELWTADHRFWTAAWVRFPFVRWVGEPLPDGLGRVR